MAYNGSGTFVINTAGQPVVPNTVISATAFNALTNDLANGLSTCITKDGQTTPTANIPMGNNKITGLAPGTSGTDAANLSQVQGSTAKLLQSVTGTDTITAAMVPALTSYSAGQMFYFVAAGDNTGAVTINIDSLGAKSVTRDGSTALVAGDIVSGEVALIVYDGTRFQLLNGNSFTNLNVSNNLTLSGGTANGVLYLNGSKVATSGSALTFDGTRLTSVTGKFGGGAAANSATLMVNNATNTATGIQLFQDGIESWIMGMPANSAGLAWSASGAEQMRLTTTGLGLGTASPAYKVDASGQVRALENGTGSGDGGFVASTSGANGNAGVLFQTNSASRWNLTTAGTNGANLRIYNYALASTVATFDSSGNLGLGVTPSAWVNATASQVGYGAAISSRSAGNTASDMTHAAYWNGTNWLYQSSSVGAARYQMTGANAGSTHQWFTSAGGTAGNAISFGDAKMTLDASGNLGVGTTSPADSSVFGRALDIQSSTGAAAYFRDSDDTTKFAVAGFYGSDSNAYYGSYGTGTGTLFLTGGTERGRFTSGGNLLVGTTTDSGYHRIAKSNTSDWCLAINNTSATTPWGVTLNYTAAAPNNTSAAFSFSDNAAERATIRNNGGLANYQTNDVNLSDERVKTDIAPLGSMWDKFKAIEIVTFKYKDQTHEDNNIGVIAQQVESVAPEFVDVDGWGETPEDGVPLKSIYTADMYHAAIKALQEAMARIEQLEAKVAALEAK